MSLCPRIENAGISSWLVRLFDDIHEGNLPWILALSRRCEKTLGRALVDLVPSYTTLLVEFDPLQITPEQVRLSLQALLSGLQPEDGEADPVLKQLPVWYDPVVGPDLTRLCEQKSLSLEQLVSLHTARVYQVYALGFAPGFAFMGTVDPRLESPRLATPRQRVRPGSVALAGRQTSAYPALSPGGWNILGRTPIRLFDRSRESMSYLQVGDRVQLVPVSKQEFLEMGGDPSPQEEM